MNPPRYLCGHTPCRARGERNEPTPLALRTPPLAEQEGERNEPPFFKILQEKIGKVVGNECTHAIEVLLFSHCGPDPQSLGTPDEKKAEI